MQVARIRLQARGRRCRHDYADHRDSGRQSRLHLDRHGGRHVGRRLQLGPSDGAERRGRAGRSRPRAAVRRHRQPRQPRDRQRPDALQRQRLHAHGSGLAVRRRGAEHSRLRRHARDPGARVKPHRDAALRPEHGAGQRALRGRRGERPGGRARTGHARAGREHRRQRRRDGRDADRGVGRGRHRHDHAGYGRQACGRICRGRRFDREHGRFGGDRRERHAHAGRRGIDFWRQSQRNGNGRQGRRDHAHAQWSFPYPVWWHRRQGGHARGRLGDAAGRDLAGGRRDAQVLGAQPRPDGPLLRVLHGGQPDLVRREGLFAGRFHGDDDQHDLPGAAHDAACDGALLRRREGERISERICRKHGGSLGRGLHGQPGGARVGALQFLFPFRRPAHLHDRRLQGFVCQRRRRGFLRRLLPRKGHPYALPRPARDHVGRLRHALCETAERERLQAGPRRLAGAGRRRGHARRQGHGGGGRGNGDVRRRGG